VPYRGRLGRGCGSLRFTSLRLGLALAVEAGLLDEPGAELGERRSEDRAELRERTMRSLKVTGVARRCVALTAVLVAAFFLLIGPLAVLYGVDSRVDDRRDGWPGTRR
jgi:hypothetical protein